MSDASIFDIQKAKTKLSSSIQDTKFQELCSSFTQLQAFSDYDQLWHGSVLLLFVEDSLFFIKRSSQLKVHPGQVACLGGHRDEGENDPWLVARREFEEETSIAQDNLELLGYIPPVFTSRNFLISPVAAYTKMTKEEFKKEVKPNEEWESGFFYPFQEFSCEDNWQHALRFGSQTNGHLLFFPVKTNEVEAIGSLEDYVLWGATARVLWNFLRLYNS